MSERDGEAAAMTAASGSGAALLCTLVAGGEGAPLHLVPSVGTTPMSLLRLARAISPRRPVRSFAYAGLEDEGPPHDSLEAMAAAYVAELLAMSPRGPYLLGGHCLGGAVALEMALQLEAAGHEVARVAVLDSVAPLLASDGSWSERQAAGGAEVAAVEKHLRSALEEIIARTVGHYPALAPDVFRRLSALLRSHIDAGVAYRARPLRAPLRVLRTEGCRDAVLDGWTRIATGGLSLHDVPGDTFSMLRPPHVEAVGETLGRVLEGGER